MFGFTNRVQQITNASGIEQPAKIVSYDFKNNGMTIANIRNVNAKPGDHVWTLYPGEGYNTFLPGGVDLTKYAVDFVAINDSDPEAQQSELIVTFNIGV